MNELTNIPAAVQRRSTSKISVQRYGAVKCLKVLGIDYKRINTTKAGSIYSKNRSLWYQSRDDLVLLLKDAKRLYKDAIRLVHPDKEGGHVDDAGYLNSVWERTEHLFNNHGIGVDGPVPLPNYHLGCRRI